MDNLAEFLLLVLAGRIIIYLWMQFPIPEWLEKSRYAKLHQCVLCSGTWIYSGLFLAFGIDLLNIAGLPHVQVVGEFISGGVISYILFLIEVGFREHFMSVVID